MEAWSHGVVRLRPIVYPTLSIRVYPSTVNIVNKFWESSVHLLGIWQRWLKISSRWSETTRWSVVFDERWEQWKLGVLEWDDPLRTYFICSIQVLGPIPCQSTGISKQVVLVENFALIMQSIRSCRVSIHDLHRINYLLSWQNASCLRTTTLRLFYLTLPDCFNRSPQLVNEAIPVPNRKSKIVDTTIFPFAQQNRSWPALVWYRWHGTIWFWVLLGQVELSILLIDWQPSLLLYCRQTRSPWVIIVYTIT